MLFNEKIESLVERSKAAQQQAMTEEATKTAVILPFIQALGFDIFSLNEVIPEFTADVGIKKGEKVDFALKIDNEISMLIEVKSISNKLGNSQYNQLYRYFTATEARLAILTNGIEVWFFSDTEQYNKMDQTPFFKFNLQNHDEKQIKELERFQKSEFEIESIAEVASNLKYTKKAAEFLRRQLLDDADEDFIRLIGRNIHDGTLTKNIIEQIIRPSVRSALDEIIRNRIQEKLNITFQTEERPDQIKSEPDNKDGIITTEEEMEAFRIICAIAAKIITVDRVFMRDAKSYCAILMDDNNRKTICRFYFNSKSVKYIGTFDDKKSETKFPIEKPSDIYRYCENIENTIKTYAKS